MSDNSAIEWTDAKLCRGCDRTKPRSAFASDGSRADGLTFRCRECRNASARGRYARRPRPAAGRRFVAPRDGDVLQARRRVNHLVDVRILPAPNDVPCFDCGHVHADGERRHEYDHYLGYEAAHHEDVQAVCTTCHHMREEVRRAA